MLIRSLLQAFVRQLTSIEPQKRRRRETTSVAAEVLELRALLAATVSLANIETTPLSYIENATTLITGDLSVSETGGTTISQATVQITGNYQKFQDQLLFTNTPELTGQWNVSTGILTIQGVASTDDYQAALRSVSYHNILDNPNPLTREITFEAGDNPPSNTQVRDLIITPVNDPPLVTTNTGTLTYIRNSTTPISPGLLVAEPDNVTLASATVQITGDYQKNEDRLIFSNTANIKGTWNVNTGTLTLTGIDSVSNYRTALRSVSYFDIQNVPNTLIRTVAFTVSDGQLSSNVATRQIKVIRQNNPPTLSAIETTPLSYTQNSTAVAITSSLLLADPDNTTLPSATVQITGNYNKVTDVLNFVDTAKITGTWDQTTGTLELNGTDTVSNYRTALRSVTFFISNAAAGNLTRTISFQSTDGQADSNVVTRKIAVTALPSITGVEKTALAYTVVNATTKVTASLNVQIFQGSVITGAKVQINVQSGDLLSATTLPGVTANWNATTGILTFTGSSSAANYQTILRSVTYNNPSQSPASLERQVSFQVFEGALASNVATRTINFAASNNQPVLSPTTMPVVNYVANDPATRIAPNIDVFDPSQLTLAGAVIQITGNYVFGQDLLKFVNTAKIKGVWYPQTGRIYLTGVDTLANYAAALRSVTYVDSSPKPSVLTRTVSFTVSSGLQDGIYDSNTINVGIKVSLT